MKELSRTQSRVYRWQMFSWKSLPVLTFWRPTPPAASRSDPFRRGPTPSRCLPPTITPRPSPVFPLQAGSTHVMNVSLDPKAPLVRGARIETFNDGRTPVLLTARVTHPEGAGFLANVTADISPIGGAISRTLYDDGTNGDLTAGDGNFSYRTVIPVNTQARSYSLNVTAKDELGFPGFGSILLDVIETVTGSVASNQSDTKTFSNAFAGQTLLISYTLGAPVQTASSKKIMSGCAVTLTVSGQTVRSMGLMRWKIRSTSPFRGPQPEPGPMRPKTTALQRSTIRSRPREAAPASSRAGFWTV